MPVIPSLNPLLTSAYGLIEGQKPLFENAVAAIADTCEVAGWIKVQVPFAGQWTQSKYPFEAFQNQIFREISIDGGVSGKIISGGGEEVYLPNPENWELVEWPFDESDVEGPNYWKDIRAFLAAEINDLGGIDGRWRVLNEQVMYEDDYQVQSIWEYFDENSETLELPDASKFVMGQALRSQFGGPQRGGYVLTSQALPLLSNNKIVLFIAYPDAPISFNSYPSWYATDQGIGRNPHPGFFKPERSTVKLRLPGMENTKIYANPYTIWANATAQGQDGSRNSLVVGVLRLFDGTRAAYASALPGFLLTKSIALHGVIQNALFYDQNNGLTLDMLYARAYRLNTEVETKIWMDTSVQCNEIPVILRTSTDGYYLGGYIPYSIMAHSVYEEGSIRDVDGRRYVAYSQNGPNTIFCEVKVD